MQILENINLIQNKTCICYFQIKCPLLFFCFVCLIPTDTQISLVSLEWQEYFSQLQDTPDALPCHVHLPVCLWIRDPHSRAQKKNTSHENEVLPEDTTHLIQRPYYQDPEGNWTTRRPPYDRKETQTAVVWSCFPFIRSGQNHLARHSERGKKTRQAEEEVGRHQGMDRPEVRQVPEKKWRTEKNGENWLQNHPLCPNDPLG